VVFFAWLSAGKEYYEKVCFSRIYKFICRQFDGRADFQRQQPAKFRKNKIIPLRLMFEQGETAHFRFLVIVYEGFRTNEQIEERFRKFAE